MCQEKLSKNYLPFFDVYLSRQWKAIKAKMSVMPKLYIWQKLGSLAIWIKEQPIFLSFPGLPLKPNKCLLFLHTFMPAWHIIGSQATLMHCNFPSFFCQSDSIGHNKKVNRYIFLAIQSVDLNWAYYNIASNNTENCNVEKIYRHPHPAISFSGIDTFLDCYDFFENHNFFPI